MLLYFIVYVITPLLASLPLLLGQSSLNQVIGNGNYQYFFGNSDTTPICTYLVYQPFLYVGTLTSIGFAFHQYGTVQVYIVRPVDDNNGLVTVAQSVSIFSGSPAITGGAVNIVTFPSGTIVLPGDFIGICAPAGILSFGVPSVGIFPVVNQGENNNIPTTLQTVGSNLAFSYQDPYSRIYAIQAYYTVTEQWLGNTIERIHNGQVDQQSECYFLTTMIFLTNATNIGWVGDLRNSASNFYVYILRPSADPNNPLVVAQKIFANVGAGSRTGMFDSSVVAQTGDFVAFCSPSSGSVVFNDGSASSGDPVVQIIEVNTDTAPLTVNKPVKISGNPKYRTYAFGIRYMCAPGLYPISPTHCDPCPLDSYCPGGNVVTACGAPSGVNRYTLALGQYEAGSCFVPPKPFSSALVKGFMKLTFQVPNDFKDRGSTIHLDEMRYTVGISGASPPCGAVRFLTDPACSSTQTNTYTCTIQYALVGGFPSDNTIYIWFVSKPSITTTDPHILDTQRYLPPLIPHLSFPVLSIINNVCTSFDGIAFPISFCDSKQAVLINQPPTSPASVDATSSGSSSTSITDVLFYTLYAAAGLIGLCFAFCGLAYLPEIIDTCSSCCGHSTREEKHTDTGKNEESALL